MTGVRVVRDDAAAATLAEGLNSRDRTRPVVVVSTPAGRSEPWIDAEEIAAEVGELADVHLILTGSHTWSFSRAMADGTQVYGGAGRVYPVGHDWVQDLRRSPLRFAYDAAEGHRATRQLVADALRMAADAGLFEAARTVRGRRLVEGTVKGFPHPERAFVELDDRTLASAIPELVVPGVPLERVLAKGMRVRGEFDPHTSRLDLRGCVLPVEQALAAYAVGEVVPAKVTAVAAVSARVRLHPGVELEVPREAVTSNDLDDLRSLMTEDEILGVRLLSAAPRWAVSLLDVGDEEPVPAAALLPGGPPWLEPATEPQPPASSALEPLTAATAAQPVVDLVAPAVPKDEPTPPAPTPPAPTSPARGAPPPAAPSPFQMDRKRRPKPSSQPVPPEPAAAPSGAVQSLSLKVADQQARLARLDRAVAELDAKAAELTNERNALSAMLAERDKRLRGVEEELRGSRAKLRKALQRRPAPQAPAPRPEFADPEQGLRYAVLTAWATRIPPAEQRDRPLPDYDVGPRFLDSLEQLEGVPLGKVCDVVVEVLIGLAHEISGRDLHQLREGPAGSPYRKRDDGATCWRAALQVNTPQARRLHYWQLPGGRIELSRVVLHDDVAP